MLSQPRVFVKGLEACTMLEELDLSRNCISRIDGKKSKKAIIFARSEDRAGRCTKISQELGYVLIPH